MIRVVTIESIGGACPFQCEGIAEDGRNVYARYRGGRFRCYVSAQPGGDPLATDGTLLIAKQYGQSLDGSMEPAEMVELTSGIVEWPEALGDQRT